MKRCISMLLILCGMAAALVSMWCCLFTIGVLSDAGRDSIPLRMAPADQVLPENEGQFVRVRGALALNEGAMYEGRLGAYRVSFVNELTLDYIVHPPESAEDALLVAVQRGDCLKVWYNLTSSPIEWYASPYIMHLSASEYMLFPWYVLMCLGSIFGSLLSFLLAYACFVGARRLWRNATPL